MPPGGVTVSLLDLSTFGHELLVGQFAAGGNTQSAGFPAHNLATGQSPFRTRLTRGGRTGRSCGVAGNPSAAANCGTTLEKRSLTRITKRCYIYLDAVSTLLCGNSRRPWLTDDWRQPL
jgi:hypothetical protein